MLNREFAKRSIEAASADLYQLAQDIHAHPELAMEEFYACQRQVELLCRYGFDVESPYSGCATAYRAVYRGKKDGSHIAFMAEYDALPELGHACGHNLICSTAIGAAIGAKSYVDEYGGTLYVYGTPAEEGLGFKVHLSRVGEFDHMNAAIMGHPACYDADSANMMAICSFHITFHGKAAHAAGSPENGINALDAMINFFNLVNAMRQQIRSDARIHGIILQGGVKPNIIPDLTEAEFYIRAASYDYMKELQERMRSCANGAALGTGCTADIFIPEDCYKDVRTNQKLADIMTGELTSLGLKNILPARESPVVGSTDAGNVSYCCPTVHSMMNITGGVPCALHTPEMAEFAKTETAFHAIRRYMEAMANTAGRLLSDPELCQSLNKEFCAMKRKCKCV